MRTVKISHLSKSFNGQNVVNDISFEISKGEVFGLIGPNGAGKTTIIRMLLEKMGMLPYKDKKISELSKGMQQKIQVIAAIISDLEFIILDEPFNGLDPVNMKLVKDLIIELGTEGKTIHISTHMRCLYMNP